MAHSAQFYPPRPQIQSAQISGADTERLKGFGSAPLAASPRRSEQLYNAPVSQSPG